LRPVANITAVAHASEHTTYEAEEQRDSNFPFPSTTTRGEPMDIGSLLAALALGFVCGVIGRAVIPNDAFAAMSGWKSWLVSTALGLLGALVGYWIFAGLFGIGDDDKFDWGGIVGAVIGAILVVAVASWAIKRFAGSQRHT
jgi:uncharacterized membrane protein YeaQ/YmgE (transglycosylase-associated protein family)